MGLHPLLPAGAQVKVPGQVPGQRHGQGLIPGLVRPSHRRHQVLRLPVQPRQRGPNQALLYRLHALPGDLGHLPDKGAALVARSQQGIPYPRLFVQSAGGAVAAGAPFLLRLFFLQSLPREEADQVVEAVAAVGGLQQPGVHQPLQPLPHRLRVGLQHRRHQVRPEVGPGQERCEAEEAAILWAQFPVTEPQGGPHVQVAQFEPLQPLPFVLQPPGIVGQPPVGPPLQNAPGHPQGQREVSAEAGDPAGGIRLLLRALGPDDGLQQGQGFLLRHRRQVHDLRSLQGREGLAGGDQDGAGGAAGEEGAHLGLVVGVIQQHQRPAAAQEGAVERAAPVQVVGGGEFLHAQGHQESPQGVGGREGFPRRRAG